VSQAAGGLPRLRQLLADGRAAEALSLIDLMLDEHPGPALTADLLLRRLAAVLGLGRRSDFPAALDAANEAVAAEPDLERSGRLNALAAIVANLDNSLERCVAHLVKSNRALGQVNRVDEDVASAWHELATAYSYAGFHGRAMSAVEMARRVAVTAGLPESEYVNPAIRVRLATWYDHHGDTDACRRILHDVLDDLPWEDGEVRGGLGAVRPLYRGSYGYAIARLDALGEPTGLDPWPLLAGSGQSVRARDLRLLGKVCGAIAAGNATIALGLLDQSTIAPSTMGAAEQYRLRTLAHLARGAYPEALAADRRTFLVATAPEERLRDLLIEGMAARLDYENMQRTVSRFRGEALTDPLTGLPNRRHLEEHVSSLVGTGHSVVLGVCDLDGFKAVNTVHGHLAGDTVLQRVAGVLARVMRRGDFVARYGGDEFVVVLPDASQLEARDVAHRIVRAVGNEDWAELVPGTPVAITVGWAEATSVGDIGRAFAAADRAMLRRKAS
jgi:diguanylate cyclase (GGDEF)-like protein